LAGVGEHGVVDGDVVDLLPGERLRWEGRPVRHRLFRSADALLVPFSIVWWVFAIFWEVSVLVSIVTSDDGPPVFFGFIGIPFTLIGLYLVVGRFAVRAVASRRTRYAVTDWRVVLRHRDYVGVPEVATASGHHRVCGPVWEPGVRRVPNGLGSV
jgi:hypothetical protein